VEIKKCRICGQSKKIHLFEVDSRTKTKQTNRCKSCKHKLDDKAAQAYRRLRRRSAKLGIPMEVTPGEIRLLFSVFDGACAYCSKKPEKARNLHLEHIIALSEEGRNTLQNLLPACVHCNSKKGVKPIATHFLENRDRFTDENMALVVDYIALLSGSKKEEVVSEMTDDHISFIKKQIAIEEAKHESTMET
jgi:5-methylcytosine-specific restriction endonuclease McrA